MSHRSKIWKSGYMYERIDDLIDELNCKLTIGTPDDEEEHSHQNEFCESLSTEKDYSFSNPF